MTSNPGASTPADTTWTSLRELIGAYNNNPGSDSFSVVRERFAKNRNVKILEEYYAPKNPNVGALLVSDIVRKWPRQERYRLRLCYDASDGDPRIGELLRSAHSEERKWSLLIPIKSQKVLEQITYTLIVYLLGFLHTQDAHFWQKASARKRLDLAAVSARREIDAIISFAKTSARKAALIRYLLGLPIGVIAIGVSTVAVWNVSFTAGGLSSEHQLALCLAFGAVGAVLSVMIRITKRQDLDVDIEQGRFVTMLAGGFRPIIGALLGAALFILAGGGLVLLTTSSGSTNGVFFYAGLAFLAGFSERWAQDTIVRSTPKMPGEIRPVSPDAPGTSAPDK